MPIDPARPCVLCVRVKDVPPTKVLPPDSRRVRCLGCGTWVVASPGTCRLVREGGVQPACRACLPRGENMVPAMTLEQVTELARYEASHETN